MREIIQEIYRVSGKALYRHSNILTFDYSDLLQVGRLRDRIPVVARFSTPTLGSAQPPIQWIQGLSREVGGGKASGAWR